MAKRNMMLSSWDWEWLDDYCSKVYSEGLENCHTDSRPYGGSCTLFITE